MDYIIVGDGNQTKTILLLYSTTWVELNHIEGTKNHPVYLTLITILLLGISGPFARSFCVSHGLS